MDWLLAIQRGRIFLVTYFFSVSKVPLSVMRGAFTLNTQNSIYRHSISNFGICFPKGILYQEISNVLTYIFFF